MPGRHLARWTLSWFASALLFLIAALALAVLLAPAPGEWTGGRGLALVHLLAIGWLSQMMFGALTQFLPVLLAHPLLWPHLSPVALALTGAGTLLLALGFTGLEGWSPGFLLLPLAPVLLGAGFGLIAVMAAGSLVPARGWREGTGRPVILAFVALGFAFASGEGMAMTVAGLDGAFAIGLDALPFHIGLAVAGWLGLGTAGVSYRLFAMFLIAPDGGSRLRTVTAGAALVLLFLLAAGLLREIATGAAPSLLLAAAFCISLTAGLYLTDIIRLWRARRRSVPEVNMQMSRPALAFLAAAALMAPAAVLKGGHLAEATVFAALIGWLSGLTLTQMIKIISFLTWIQVFAARIGRGALPQVHELVDETASRRWLSLWFGAAALGTLALLAGQSVALRLSFALLLVAALGIVRQIWRIRRLALVPPAMRPDCLPPLFLPPARTEPLQ
ncbi:hypothetical protein [Paracoccus marinaquae]|uniref:NnrS family protein n=1 Tax=Paracoccus marinaquae TaxID=2841926 RepID=A0ABS6AJ98_9RHOB|nr:hypothetical protein [Paracoccus marinaquae]MBU3030589.1 hypothetical protein [Paracoccus marinaquae]